jgi:hypothetical protein
MDRRMPWVIVSSNWLTGPFPARIRTATATTARWRRLA